MCDSGEASVRELTAGRCPIQSGNATDPVPLTLLPGPVSTPLSTHAHAHTLTLTHTATELTAWPQQRANHIT